MMHEMARGGLAAAVVASIVGVASGARAEEGAADRAEDRAGAAAPLFGRRGSVVLDDLFGVFVGSAAPLPGTGAIGFSAGWIALSSTKVEGGDASVPGTSSAQSSLTVAPSLDVFVTDNLTIGGSAAVFARRARYGGGGAEMHQYGAGLAPRIGWAVPLGEGLALWPRVRGGFGVAGGDLASAEPSFSVGADGLLVVALGRHALLDVGPRVSYARSAVGTTTAYGAALGMSGGLSLVF